MTNAMCNVPMFSICLIMNVHVDVCKQSIFCCIAKSVCTLLVVTDAQSNQFDIYTFIMHSNCT